MLSVEVLLVSLSVVISDCVILCLYTYAASKINKRASRIRGDTRFGLDTEATQVRKKIA